MKTIDEALTYFESKGILDAVKRNTETCISKTTGLPFKFDNVMDTFRMIGLPVNSLLESLFAWEGTPEGPRYWREVNQDFQVEFLEEKNEIEEAVQKFTNYLKGRGLYEKFEHNMKNDPKYKTFGVAPASTIESYAKTVLTKIGEGAKDLMDCAFCFDTAPEGSKFWLSESVIYKMGFVRN